MRSCLSRWIRVGIGLAMVLWTIGQAHCQGQPSETVTVSKTFNNAPFDYRSRLLVERGGLRIYRLTYPSPVVTPVAQNNTIPADFYLPTSIRPGDPRRPAAICLHVLGDDEQLTDLVCSVLAGRGVPAISFKLPYHGDRGSREGPKVLVGNPKLFVEAIVQMGEDVRRTVDLLASRPEINPERIGITGISLGAITAATAAGAEPRLYRASLLLSGGDLLQIIRHDHREIRPLGAMIRQLPPPERAEVEAKIAQVDPLRFAPALRDRARQGRVLMINAAEDEVVPRPCTEKLAAALGIADRVVWLEGLGHYTAIAELPRALRMTADFFAQDLPEGARSPNALGTEVPSPPPTAQQRLVSLVEQATAMLTTEPNRGRCHFVDVELSASVGNGQARASRLRFVRGPEGRFSLRCQLPEIGQLSVGQDGSPWMVAGEKTLLAGTKNPLASNNPLGYVEPRHLMRLRMAAGIAGGIVLAPAALRQWIAVEDDKAATGDNGRAIRITAKEKLPGEIRLTFRDDGRTPDTATFTVAGVQGKLHFRGWQTNTIAPDALFDPPDGLQRREIEQSDLYRIFAAILNSASERLESGGEVGGAGQPDAMAVLARDPAGHGLLCRCQGKTILFVSGTPAQMGAAHGTLLRESARKAIERVLYLAGGTNTLRSGEWFFERMAEIERRTLPHIPPRFLDECDAMAKAAGISQRDGRYANLFAERFHCSSVALRGKATVGGRVLQGRVLDYMCEIGLQDSAAVQVFLPEGRHKWMSLGYAGFLGTVTAMNEKGLAIADMGGHGEGHWDGIPMSLLQRDVMERAATVEEALAIIRAAPRTCEYYYVLSDRSGAMRALYCPPNQMTVLEPGQQHPLLPLVPEDTVFVSLDNHAKALSQRIQENYGKIDVPKLIEIIKRPVAGTNSNLHNAIFAPETLEMWFADARRFTSGACDEPYARVSLRELLQFYAEQADRARQ